MKTTKVKVQHVNKKGIHKPRIQLYQCTQCDNEILVGMEGIEQGQYVNHKCAICKNRIHKPKQP